MECLAKLLVLSVKNFDTSPGARLPFPECRCRTGHLGGVCGNCKWPDHTARCAVRDQDEDSVDETEGPDESSSSSSESLDEVKEEGHSSEGSWQGFADTSPQGQAPAPGTAAETAIWEII